MLKLQKPWDSQPQDAGAELSASALAEFGLCGGFIADGAHDIPKNLDGSDPVPSVGALGQHVGFTRSPGQYGQSALNYDTGLTRYLRYTLGAPQSRNFTFLTRVRYNSTTPTLVLRSGDTGAGTTILLWRNGGAFDMRVAGTDYTAAGTWNVGQWYDIEIVGTAADCVLYVDGVAVISGAAATSASLDANFCFGDVVGAAAVTSNDIEFMHCLVANRALDSAARASLRANPWQLFAPRSIWVPVSVGGGTAVNADLGTASAIGYDAGVNANRTIAANLGTATASGFTATVGQNTSIAASLGTAVALGYDVTVGISTVVSAALGTAAALGYDAFVSNGSVVSANLGTATALGYDATVGSSTTISASLGTAAALGYDADVSNGYGYIEIYVWRRTA